MIVYYDASRDLIYAEGTKRVWPSRSLVIVPSTTDDTVTIAMATSLLPVLGPLPPAYVQRQDGTGFADQASAVAYLQGEFARFDADQDGTPIVASVAMPAGTPVSISRADGTLVSASAASSKPLAFVVGVLRQSVEAGFAAVPSRGAVTLSDWTAAAGQPSLLVGQPYFLAAAGGLTTAPNAQPIAFITRIGLADSATTLAVRPFDPIQL